MDAEIVIRGGTVVDGTGAPGTPADVAVDDGRIVAVGEGLTRRRASSTPSGQVVAPGFIDIHTHYDAQVFWDPQLTPSAFHGVTTVVAGNCGFSIAPVRPGGVDLLARTLQHVEDMSFDTLAAGVPWDAFETFPQYLDAVERARGRPQLRLLRRPHRRAALRHGRRRLRAPGHRRPSSPTCSGRSPTPWPPGPIGFATSASPTHNGAGGRPVPSRVADLAELAALLEPVRDAGTRRRGAAAGRGDPRGRGVRAAAADRSAVHLDRAADGQGPRRTTRASSPARRGLGRRRRGVAPGLVPAARRSR